MCSLVYLLQAEGLAGARTPYPPLSLVLSHLVHPPCAVTLIPSFFLFSHQDLTSPGSHVDQVQMVSVELWSLVFRGLDDFVVKDTDEGQLPFPSFSIARSTEGVGLGLRLATLTAYRQCYLGQSPFSVLGPSSYVTWHWDHH